MISEFNIQIALYKKLEVAGHRVIIPNVSWSFLTWEADMISVTKANYLNEYEIKISRQDFYNDFRKKKHYYLKNLIKYSTNIGSNYPNYFWYIAPLKAIPLCLPDYAGLMQTHYINRYEHKIILSEIKKPKLLHNKKQTDKNLNKMLHAMSMRYWKMAINLNNNKIQKKLW